MLAPKKPGLFNKVLEKTRVQDNAQQFKTSANSVMLDNDELTSQDTSMGNVTSEILSNFVSKNERQKQEFEESGAKAIIEKQNKIKKIEANEIWAKVKEAKVQKVGAEKADDEVLELFNNSEKLSELEDQTILGKLKTTANQLFNSIVNPLPSEMKAALIASTLDTFVDKKPFTGLNKTQAKEYEKRNLVKQKELNPILDNIRAKYDLERKSIEEQLKVSQLKSVAKMAKGEDHLPDSQQGANFLIAKRQYDDIIDNIDDYTSGNMGFLSGLLSQKKDLGSMGIYSMYTDLSTVLIKNKADRIEKEAIANQNKIDYKPTEALDESEKAVLATYAKKQELEALNLEEGKTGYGWGKGVAGSVVMMEGMVAAGGLTGAVEKGVANFLVKGAFENSLKEVLKQGGKKALLSTITARAAGGAASLSVGAVATPMMYQQFAKDNLGEAKIITDENGKEKVLIGESLYNKKLEEFNQKTEMLTDRQLELSRKQKPTNTEKQELEALDNQLTGLKEEFDMLAKPHTTGESLLYGFTESVKENFSEKYVGEALPGVFNNMATRAIGNTIGKTKVGKFAKEIGEHWVDEVTPLYKGSLVDRGIKGVSKGYGKARNLVNNAALGKLSGEAIAHTGRAQLLSNLPGEVAEEVWNQLIPTYKQDYSRQLEELTNPDFYVDVIAQTLIMGGGFATAGMGVRANNYRLDKQDIKKMYKGLNASVNDADVAKHIMMNTGGTLYNPAQYDYAIHQLKQQGKIEAANKLEQKKFVNLAGQAIRTGTVKNFENVLEKLQAKPDITPETKLNLQLAQGRIQELKSVYDEHSEKDNFGNIFNLAERKLANKQAMQEMQKELISKEEVAKEEIDSFLQRKGYSVDYSMETLLDRQFENELNRAEYHDFLDDLSEEGITTVDIYTDLLKVKTAMQESQNNTMKLYNEQVHPKYAENIAERKEINAQYDAFVAEIEGERTLDNSENDLEQTPEMVDQFIREIKESYGGTIKSEVFDDVAAVKKEEIYNKKLKKEEENQQKTLQYLLDQRNQVTQNQEDVIIDETTPVVVIDDIAEQQTAGVVNHRTEDTLALFEISNEGLAVPGTTVIPTGVVLDSEFDSQIGGETNYTDEQLQAVKLLVKQAYTELSNLLGRVPTFREVMEYQYKYTENKESVKALFPHIIKGWELNNYPTESYQAVYDDLFDPIKSISVKLSEGINNLFATTATITPKDSYIEQEEVVFEIQEDIAKRTTTVIGYDEENAPIIKSDVELINSQRTLTVVPKLGFSAMLYEEVNSAGVFIKKTLGNMLNIGDNSLIDFRDLINPDMYPPGSKLQIEIADENLWNRVTVSNGRTALGDTIKTTFSQWVAEKEKTNPDFRNTQEFRDKVPMFYTDAKGKRLAYVHDTEWYNPYNVGNPYGSSDNPNLPTEQWMNHIKIGIENTRTLRDNIHRGLKEVSIEKASNGMFHKIPMELPRISIMESNPQSIIVVQRGSDLHTSFSDTFKGILLNTDENNVPGSVGLKNNKGESTNGHTWYINRIGLGKNDKGETVPTYEALPILRTISAEQVETVQWALAAHLTFKGFTTDLRGSSFAMSMDKAKQLQKDINKQTGYNIENTNDVENFIRMYVQGENMPTEGTLNKYRQIFFKEQNPIDSLKQHTNLKSLSKVKNMVHIINGNVESLNQSYEDYLKTTLQTNVRSFNVGTELDPVYATSIQPIISVSYNEVSKEEKAPVVSTNPRVEAINAALGSLETSAEQTSKPLDTEEHTEFLKNLGVNPNDFLESDDMIADTSKLASIFKVVGNLSIQQEKTIRQYILHNIGEKVSFAYKSKISETKIKEEIRSELNLILRGLQKELNSRLEIVKNSTDANTATGKAIITAYTTTLNNMSDVQANYAEIYDKAFKDIQLQTKLTVLRAGEVQEETVDTVSKNVNTDEKDEAGEDIDDISLSIKDYNKDSIEESGKAKASYRLRRFLHKINRYDAKGNKQTGYLAIPTYMSFNDVYNELSKVLAMGSEVVSDYNLIIAKLEQSPASFVKEVLAKLSTADEQIKNEFVSNFVRHNLTSKFAMYENTKKGVSLKVYNTNANEATRIIDKKWKNDNRSSGLYSKDGSINTAYAQNLVDTFTNWKESTNDDYTKIPQAELRTWLEKVGISFEDAAWDIVYKEGIYNSQKQNTFKELFNQNSGGLFVPIVNFLKTGIADPIGKGLDSDKTMFSELNNVIKALTLVEAKYNPNLITLSFRDSGKNISTLVPTKFVTDMVENLKRGITDPNNTIISDLQGLSLSENSTILEMLKEIPSFKGLFNISHLSLTAIKEKGDSPIKAGITDLGEIDYDMATATGFTDRKVEKLPDGTKVEGVSMRMASMMMPTMSDKSTAMFLNTAVFDFMKDSSLFFETNEDGSVASIGAEIKELLFNKLVLPELKRIVKFHREIKRTNIKDYDNGAQLFHFLPIMNTLKDEDGTNIIAKIADPKLEFSLEEVLTKYKETFVGAIEGIVKSEVDHKKALWAPYTEVNGQGKTFSKMFDTNYFLEAGKNPAKDYELGIYDFVLNNLLFNSEVFKVFAGDVALYSKDKNYKENGQKVAPSAIKSDATYVSINKEIGVNLGKRLALLIAPGSKIADSFKEEYNQIFLEDSIDITENAEYLIKNFYSEKDVKEAKPLLDKYAKAVALLDQHEEGILRLNPERYSKLKGLMGSIRKQLANTYPELDAYFDIESTDAQEYSTATEHISLLHRMGRVSDEELKTISTKLLSVDKDGNPTENGYLTKEELNLVFQPVKPVHTGTYVNKQQDVNRTVYIKSSSFPLIPQLTAGTKLDNLRISMEKLEGRTGRYTRASFQTANKVGSTVNTINPFDINSLIALDSINNNTDVNNLVDTTVLKLKRDNFRIQQDVPFKSDKKADDKVSMGTQFFKLLFGDGVIENYKEEDRDNYAHFPLNGGMVTGKELYNHYNKSFAAIVDTKKKGLFNELGLSPEGVITDQNKFMINLQDLLLKEATSRGYSIKSLAGLKIEQLASAAGLYYEFKTPLWLSSDSNRYESLLNSIVTNRLMKHKMPGNGFVAGSESGFKFKKDLKGIEKSRIIYLDNWNGKELQGAHTVTDENGNTTLNKHQVFVPSKFKDANKKLIDLFEGYDEATKEGKFIYRRDNGTLGLKEGAISPELLNIFSFRTPTSSHVSGSSIEIAGILPPEVGDLMIVPKNFTKQKGLDYDIDKESAYQLNHHVNSEGSIVPLTQASVDEITQKLKDKIAEFNRENTFISSKSNAFNELFKQFIEENAFGNMLDEESLETLMLPQLDPANKLARIELELERKLAENEFIKSHLAVFNSTNKDIQVKVNKILSIDFAKEQADIIEKLNQEGERNAKINKSMEAGVSELQAGEAYDKEQLNFTILTNSYQKSKMDLGSIGKVAIGVYANYTTFNGLLQQNTGDPVYLQDEEGNPQSITIGNFTSNGTLGVNNTLAPTSNIAKWKELHSRSTADAFAEKENTATDNEKEQVLGRVGVNDATINVDALMTLLGFDKDENGNSIPYMLLSQPIIKEFNKRKKDSKGILGTFLKEETLVTELTSKYGGETSEISVPSSPSILTGEALLEGIKFNGQNSEVQIAALNLYLSLEAQAKAVSTVQKTINTNNLGKSMIESQLKYEALKTLPDNKTVANAAALLGDFSREQGDRTDGTWIGGYYVTPNTPQGQIVINGLHIGNTIYQDFFPYQDEAIISVVKEILAIQGKQESSDSVVIEGFENIIENIKKYVYSRKDNNIFNIDPRAKRFELFKDTETNTSLSTYLKDVVKNKDRKFRRGIESVAQNTLLKSFSYETGVTEEELSLIKYNNSATDNLDEEDLYNSIPELILADETLPHRNGQPYSTKMLAIDLASYAYLQGGIQKATEFVKYVPVEYLESIGKYEGANNEFVPANRKLQIFSSKLQKIRTGGNIFANALGVKEDGVSVFARQYFQHNPDKAPKASYKDKKNEKDGLFNYTDKQGNSPSFISIKGQKGSVEKYGLYENLGNGLYHKVDVLGNKGVAEYEWKNENVVGINTNALPVIPQIFNTDPQISNSDMFTISENTTYTDLLTQISQASLSPEYVHLSEAAKWLLPLVKQGILDKKQTSKLVMSSTMTGAGKAFRESLDIHLNPGETTDVSKDKTALVFVHELIHTLSSNEILNYFEVDGVTLKQGIEIPAYVTNLILSFNHFKTKFSNEIDSLQNKINGQADAFGSTEFTEREKNVIYAGVNIREFMAVSLTSPMFQEEMSKIEYRSSGNSIWEKIKKNFIDILEAIYPSLKNDTIAKDAVMTSFNFITEEAKARIEIEQLSMVDIDLQLEIERALAEEQSFNTQDTSREIKREETIEKVQENEVNLPEEEMDPFNCK